MPEIQIICLFILYKPQTVLSILALLWKRATLPLYVIVLCLCSKTRVKTLRSSPKGFFKQFYLASNLYLVFIRTRLNKLISILLAVYELSTRYGRPWFIRIEDICLVLYKNIFVRMIIQSNGPSVATGLQPHCREGSKELLHAFFLFEVVYWMNFPLYFLSLEYVDVVLFHMISCQLNIWNRNLCLKHYDNFFLYL